MRRNLSVWFGRRRGRYRRLHGRGRRRIVPAPTCLLPLQSAYNECPQTGTLQRHNRRPRAIGKLAVDIIPAPRQPPSPHCSPLSAYRRGPVAASVLSLLSRGSRPWPAPSQRSVCLTETRASGYGTIRAMSEATIRQIPDLQALFDPSIKISSWSQDDTWLPDLIDDKGTVEEAWRAGDVLLRIRQQLPHGAWLPARKERGIAYTTANRSIRLRRQNPQINQLGEFGSVSVALTGGRPVSLSGGTR